MSNIEPTPEQLKYWLIRGGVEVNGIMNPIKRQLAMRSRK